MGLDDLFTDHQSQAGSLVPGVSSARSLPVLFKYLADVIAGDLKDPLSIFLNSLGAHIAITLCVMEDEDKRRNDGNKHQQNKAHTKSIFRQ
jgi:hypothetical protein